MPSFPIHHSPFTIRRVPKLAVFPKAFMDALCVDGSLSLRQWIDLAATLDVEGLEFYGGFLDLQEPAAWPVYRRMVEDAGLVVPMLCCSPERFLALTMNFVKRKLYKTRGNSDGVPR